MNASVEIDHENMLLTVCAWCHPGDSVYQAMPHLKALNYIISHGICESCRKNMSAPKGKPLSYFTTKYGPDFLKKVPLYKTATLNGDYVAIKQVLASGFGIVATKIGGEEVRCDVRELDDFVL